MVVLNRIYTKSGDKGTTALASGTRRPKHDLRVEAYGTVDETNATLGLCRLHTADHPSLDAMLARIQNDLFDLGADLAAPQNEMKADRPALRVTEQQVSRLEQEIDEMNALQEPLKSFTLPGGTPLAAHLHLTRTVSRRAERLVCALRETDPDNVNPAALTYLNRLSDFCFVASRHANENGKTDVLWVPGDNR